MMELEEIKVFTGASWPIFVTQMLSRDLFAVAILLVFIILNIYCEKPVG